MRRFLAGSLLSFLAATTVAAQDVSKTSTSDAPRIETLASPVTVRLRGLSAVDENIAWASGREGTVLRTTDGGKTWSVFKVPGAEKLDFRDVEGFSADEAVVLSIGPGEDSRIYRTGDGGKTWSLVLRNSNPNAFFDCFSFDGTEGRLLGDPVDGRFEVLRTSDAGKTWAAIEGPVAKEGESAFAASGTCILRKGTTTVVASGGSVARAHWIIDGLAIGKQPAVWSATEVSASAPAPSAGYFSVASGGLGFFIVGGDYKLEQSEGLAMKLGAGVVHFGVDSGGKKPAHGHREGNEDVLVPARKDKRIEAVALLVGSSMPAPRGYRSGVACSEFPPVFCGGGPGGADTWDSAAWQPLQGAGYDSVDVAGNVFWFSGDDGRLGRLVLPK